VLVPESGHVGRAVFGQALQEFGLKLHMYNTFYHYQQASLDPAWDERNKTSPQPLYQGSWDDVLLAPFKWKNIRRPEVFIPTVLIGGFLYYSYRNADIVRRNHFSNSAEETAYELTNGVEIPLGSSFGEDVLYQGFVQREMEIYTGSFLVALGIQTALFTMSHTPRLRPGAAVGGLYFGLMNHFHQGDLEPGIATHFWVDFISGTLDYLLFRKREGKGVPLSISASVPF
jgi:hypothetical protein